jgi:hypothetical protein
MSNTLLTSQSRVFIAPRGAGCGKSYTYYACMKLGGLDRQTGEATPVYCPDKSRPGVFKQVATIRGAESPWSSSVSGYKPLGVPSALAKLAAARCKFDIQIHFGACNDLSDFDDYELAIVLENVEISDYSIDGLGALNGGEVKPVLESCNLKAANSYEIYDSALVEVASALLVTGGQIAGVAYSAYACSTGTSETCQNFYALQLPGTYGVDDYIYLLASSDGGLSWVRYSIDDFPIAEGEPIRSAHIACAGDYIVICLDTGNEPDGLILSIPASLLDAADITSYSQVSIGATIRRLRTIGSRVYAVTDEGHVFWFKPSQLAPNFLEDGTLYPLVWYDIHGIDAENLLVVGATGTLAHRRKGASFRTVQVAIDGTPILSNFSAVFMKTADEWLVGTDVGELFCTNNAGRSFVQVGSFTSEIVRIDFPTRNCGYLVVGVSPARIYKSTDGGNQWVEVNSAGVGFTDYTELRDIAVCPSDPSVFVAVGDTAPNLLTFGLSDTDMTDGMDGIIIIGD